MNPPVMPHPTVPVDVGAPCPKLYLPAPSGETLASCASPAERRTQDDSSEFQRLYNECWQLYPVKSAVGRMLLRQLTTQLQLLDLGSRAELEAITLGTAAGQLLQNGSPSSPGQTGILCAVNNPATAGACQYQASHLRLYQQLVPQLVNLLRLENSRFQDFDIRRFFTDEQACQQHLRTRLEHSGWRCPRCESPRGDWLNSTGRWECRECHHQVGVRHGTVMFRSKIPLTKWFHLIDLVCHEPPMTGPELGRRLGIARESTVRGLETTVRSALQLPDSDRLLAGLPQYRYQVSHLNQVVPLPANEQRDRLRSPCPHLTQIS